MFDIQRFALHDGPGIRTVAFLKGCPLRCRWCCNPESVSTAPVLMHDRESCAGCMTCAERCPEGAVRLREGKAWIDRERCTACGRCAEHCPRGVLKVAGYRIGSEALVAELARDEPYFISSGGGITLSGGEPMMQAEFAVEVLSGMRSRGIHTCMETSGFAPDGAFREAARVTDQFLVDYKLDDAIRHKRYTGLDNARVVRTLELLAELNARVVLRAIVIPGVNDDAGHLEALARLQKRMPNIAGIDIMAFHHFGSRKYADLGLPAPELYSEEVTPEMVVRWVEVIRAAGGINVNKG